MKFSNILEVSTVIKLSKRNYCVIYFRDRNKYTGSVQNMIDMICAHYYELNEDSEYIIVNKDICYGDISQGISNYLMTKEISTDDVLPRRELKIYLYPDFISLYRDIDPRSLTEKDTVILSKVQKEDVKSIMNDVFITYPFVDLVLYARDEKLNKELNIESGYVQHQVSITKDNTIKKNKDERWF